MRFDCISWQFEVTFSAFMRFGPQQFSAPAIVVKPDTLPGKICLHSEDPFGWTPAHSPFGVNTQPLNGGVGTNIQ